MLHCVAMCCSVLQCDTVVSPQSSEKGVYHRDGQRKAIVYTSICCALQCVAMCCSTLQHTVLQCVTVCYSVSQCVAVCCRMLQFVAVCCSSVHQIREFIARDQAEKGRQRLQCTR